MRLLVIIVLCACLNLSKAQQWQFIDTAPCTIAEMTADGVGFCSHSVSMGQGGSFAVWIKFYFTDDDWSSSPQFIDQTTSPGGLYCGPERLSRSSPTSVAFEFECIPSFVGWASQSGGMSDLSSGIGIFGLQDFDGFEPVGDSVCFVAGFMSPDYVLWMVPTTDTTMIPYAQLLTLPGMYTGPAALAFLDRWTGVFTLNHPGDSLTIRSTQDGGLNWQVLYDGVGPTINDAEFMSGNVVFAVGDDGAVLRSNDTGNTWLPIAIPTTSDLVSVDGYSGDSVWVAGQNGAVFATGDGGISWTAMPQLPGTVRKIQALDSAIYGHTTAGLLYRYVAAGDPDAIEEPFFRSSDTGLILALKPGETVRSLRVCNALGATMNVNTSMSTVDLVGASPGLYIVMVETDLRVLLGRTVWMDE